MAKSKSSKRKRPPPDSKKPAAAKAKQTAVAAWQKQWQEGKKDIQLSAMPSKEFQAALRTQQHKNPALSLVQILNAIFAAHAAYSKMARKVLQKHDIKPWTPAAELEGFEKKPKGKTYWLSVSESAKVPLITAILRKTRPTRSSIDDSAISTWATNSDAKQSSEHASTLLGHIKFLLKKEPQSSFEEMLIRTLKSNSGPYTIAKTILWDLVRDRPDMQLDPDTMQRLVDKVVDPALPDEGSSDTVSSDEEEEEDPTDDELEQDSENEHQLAEEAQQAPSLKKKDDRAAEAARQPRYARLKEHEILESRAASWNSSNGSSAKPSKRKLSVSSDQATPPMKTARLGSSEGAFTNPPHSRVPAVRRRDLVQLGQLTEEEQELQVRYFKLKHPTDIVTCLNCGKKGHMAIEHVKNPCSHCNGHHAEANCAARRKCYRCRQRGHSGDKCSRPHVRAGAIGDECDLCGRPGHAEGECFRLASSLDLSQVLKVSAKYMDPQCYNCAGKHWGDDCPTLPESARRRTIWCNAWSMAWASNFFYDIEEKDTPPVAQQNGGSIPAYQLGLLADD